MQRPILRRCQTGFLECFGVRRVRVAHTGDIFGGCSEFHRYYGFCNHIGRPGSDHVNAE